MSKERPQFTPKEVQTAIEGARTFIPASTFADNFRFLVAGLVKIAERENPTERANSLRPFYSDQVDEYIDEGESNESGVELSLWEIIYLKKIFEQMSKDEALDFIETNRRLLLSLKVTKQDRFDLLRDPEKKEELNDYNSGLETIATALLGMNVAPWKFR